MHTHTCMCVYIYICICINTYTHKACTSADARDDATMARCLKG